ncbi:hypothetical protein B0A55_11163 [Friedmanniomyces simplex]|uniref:F-box domain-containing protein n=1 Tax=Friedmanniomyces simplex TaxID=329884 RepID=A0A4V5NFC6_9PEZI|nr:hypothetical protein B0A55_11163 [Friedmanniomyces simplex]
MPFEFTGKLPTMSHSDSPFKPIVRLVSHTCPSTTPATFAFGAPTPSSSWAALYHTPANVSARPFPGEAHSVKTTGPGAPAFGNGSVEGIPADLDFFRPRAASDERHAMVAKTGDGRPLGAVGHRRHDPDQEALRCCEKKPEIAATRFINAHMYLSEHDKALLGLWMRAQLKTKTTADTDTATEMVLGLLQCDLPDAMAKSRCRSQLQRVLLDNTSDFVDELFQTLATRSYDTGRRYCKRARDIAIDNPTSPAGTFRFLELPAELRNWIYQETIVLGEVRLRSCHHFLPYSVTPSPTLGVSAVCKQINKETKDLIFENTFIVDGLVDAGRGRMFHSQILPNHILTKLTSLTIIFNLRSPNGDWRQLRPMTGLRRLTICGFDSTALGLGRYHGRWGTVLRNVLESVPGKCKILFGPRTAAENQHLHSMTRAVIEQDGREDAVARVDTTELKLLASEVAVTVVKGSKSGGGAPQSAGLGVSSTWAFVSKGLI